MTQHAWAWPLSHATFATLPPAALPNLRTVRYRGGTFTVPLARFAPADQHTLRAMYVVLHGLWTTLTTAPTSTLSAAVRAVRAHHDWLPLVQQMAHLGAATHDSTLDLVIHDLRGGSFSALVGALDLLTRDSGVPHALPTLLVLVRDHLHTLRNLVPDLDAPGAEADQQAAPQSIERLVEKWRYAPAQAGDHVARVHLDVQVQDAIAARPSELAAMDKVLTNLVNNAVRFAANGQVYLAVLPHAAGQDVRIAVSNRLTAAQQYALQTHFGTDWRGLFADSFTTGGTGLGLRICAAYVAECYGLAGTQQAVAGQYLAATVMGQTFVAHFHWPLLPASGDGRR